MTRPNSLTPPQDMTTTDAVAGRALDAEVAEKIMGWTWRQTLPEFGTGVVYRVLSLNSLDRPVANGDEPPRDPNHSHGARSIPHYSTDIAAAWLVVEKMSERRFHARIMTPFLPCDDYFVGFTPQGTTGWNGRPDHQEYAPSAPLAICLAALASVEVPNA